jgi:hypothetical protein
MLLRPLWPIVNYVANYDYIVENFCINKDKPELECNGQCYLMKQLAEQTDEDQTNPFEKQKKSESSEIVYLETFNYSIPFVIQMDVSNLIGYRYNLSLNEGLSILDPPPKV